MSKRAASVQLTSDNVDEQEEIQEEAGEFQVASQEEIQQRVIKKAKRGKSSEQVASGSGGIFAKLQQSLGSASSLSSSSLAQGKGGLPSLTSASSQSQGKGLFQFSASSASAALKFGGSTSCFPPRGPTPSAATIKLGGDSSLRLGSGGTTSGSTLLGSTPANTVSGSTPQFNLGGCSTKLNFGYGLPVSGPPGAGTSGSGSTPATSSNPAHVGVASSAPVWLGGASTRPAQFGFKVPHTTEYLQQLGSLNQSVSQWISKHVATNPYVDLTPIFRDYKAHLGDIDAKYNVGPGSETESSQPESEDVVMEGSSEGGAESRTESDGNSNAEVISISDSTPRDSPDVTPGPSVASTATPTPPPSTSGNPGSSTAPSEDDSLLAVRAKLFYKKESEFVDLGVGNLKVQSSSKGMVHLLMRNDTSLGTVLLNVKVSGDMPVSCSKKSVLVVCPTPNPPLSVGEGPVTYLLRVKTTELAEQLLKAIQDNTKA